MSDDQLSLAICVDCAILAANGELPEDPKRADDVARGFGEMYTAGYVVVVAEGEHDATFSWHRCDVCHSTLGGERFNAAGLPRSNASST